MKRLPHELDEAANRLRKKMQGPAVNLRHGVTPPTDEEVQMHNATHLPFQEWCDVCLKTKSRENYSLHSADYSIESSGKPQIQLGFMFLGQIWPSLLMVDPWTRMGKIVPTTTKSATRSLAEEAVNFSLELQYLKQDVEFVMDGEPLQLHCWI